MKPILMALGLMFSAGAYAADPVVYEADCGMQTVPKSPNEAPVTFAKRHVKIPSGQGITIYKDGALTYTADFYADDIGQPLYMLTISLVDTSHGRKVTQANISTHDLQALEKLIAGLYLPGKQPTAACGTQM